MEPYFGWKNVSKIAIKKIKNTIREKKKLKIELISANNKNIKNLFTLSFTDSLVKITVCSSLKIKIKNCRWGEVIEEQCLHYYLYKLNWGLIKIIQKQCLNLSRYFNHPATPSIILRPEISNNFN